MEVRVHAQRVLSPLVIISFRSSLIGVIIICRPTERSGSLLSVLCLELANSDTRDGLISLVLCFSVL